MVSGEIGYGMPKRKQSKKQKAKPHQAQVTGNLQTGVEIEAERSKRKWKTEAEVEKEARAIQELSQEGDCCSTDSVAEMTVREELEQRENMRKLGIPENACTKASINYMQVLDTCEHRFKVHDAYVFCQECGKRWYPEV